MKCSFSNIFKMIYLKTYIKEKEAKKKYFQLHCEDVRKITDQI